MFQLRGVITKYYALTWIIHCYSTLRSLTFKPTLFLRDILSHTGVNLIAELHAHIHAQTHTHTHTRSHTHTHAHTENPDKEAELLRLTHPESFLLDIFWQEWNWILKIITFWKSRRKQARVSCWSTATVIYAPTPHTPNTQKISKREYVTNGLWEGDTDALFLPFAFHNRSNFASCLLSMQHCTLTFFITFF